MKCLIFLLILISLFMGSCSNNSLYYMETTRITVPNLVANPGFELIDAKAPASPLNWYVVTSSPDLTEPVVLDSTNFLSGRKSLKLLSCDRNIYIVSDAFRVNFTGMFYAKCSLKSARNMRKPTKVYFWAYDTAGNKRNSFGKGIRVRTDWTKAAINAGFLKNPVNFARIAIFIPQDKGNSVWLDDAGCYMVYQLTKE